MTTHHLTLFVLACAFVVVASREQRAESRELEVGYPLLQQPASFGYEDSCAVDLEWDIASEMPSEMHYFNGQPIQLVSSEGNDEYGPSVFFVNRAKVQPPPDESAVPVPPPDET